MLQCVALFLSPLEDQHEDSWGCGWPPHGHGFSDCRERRQHCCGGPERLSVFPIVAFISTDITPLTGSTLWQIICMDLWGSHAQIWWRWLSREEETLVCKATQRYGRLWISLLSRHLKKSILSSTVLTLRLNLHSPEQRISFKLSFFNRLDLKNNRYVFLYLRCSRL